MINVNSEVNLLKKVLVHKPGKEFLNLTEDSMNELLFDDIPFLDSLIKEHDAFVKKLKDNEIEVVYLEDLVSEVLSANDDVRIKFIAQFVDECSVKTKKRRIMLAEYLNSISDTKELVLKTIEGILFKDVIDSENIEKTLVDMVDEELFIAKPMVNLLKVRDPFLILGKCLCLNNMKFDVRSREAIYSEYIFKYHIDYKGTYDLVYNRYYPNNIEGGDILNLNKETILVGMSAQTDAASIDELAKNLFQNQDCGIKNIIAIDLPKNKFIRHLDSVLTQVDDNKFVYFDNAFKNAKIYSITEGNDPTTYEDLTVVEIGKFLEEVLSDYLARKVILIPCGNDYIEESREQLNSACNVFAINSGVVISYSRNIITNTLLTKNGIKVIEVPSSELSRCKCGVHSLISPLIRLDK